MLRSFLCLSWVDSGSEIVQLWLHFGSILGPFGVFGGVLWRQKLPSRTEDRWGKLALLHFKRFWAQKGATRRPKIDEKSMQKSMRNSAGFLHGLGSVFGRLWGVFGPWTLDFECFVSARRYFSKFHFFHVWVYFFVILGGFGVVWGVILGAKGRRKWLQNLIKMSDFWIALGSGLGRQRAE